MSAVEEKGEGGAPIPAEPVDQPARPSRSPEEPIASLEAEMSIDDEIERVLRMTPEEREKELLEYGYTRERLDEMVAAMISGRRPSARSGEKDRGRP